MSNAEYLALEKYPQRSVLVVPARGGGYYADSHLREGFIEGYHQAEKDLALTWEDMKLIQEIQLYICAIKVRGKKMTEKEQFGEVLKRFNEERDKL